jgi:hypothetical protein
MAFRETQRSVEWGHNEASIAVLPCVVTAVHRVWFVVACFGHPTDVHTMVIWLLWIRVVTPARRKCCTVGRSNTNLATKN